MAGVNLVATSLARNAVKLLMPALAAAYPHTRVIGRKEAIDEKLTIVPLPASTMGFRNTWVGITVPVRLRLRTLSNSCTLRSKKLPVGAIVAPGMLPPAALSRASTFPYFARISAQFSSTFCASITSVTRKMASPPLALISPTILSPSSLRRPISTTLAPSRARYSPMQAPRTPVPPVMTTTLSFTENSSFIL